MSYTDEQLKKMLLPEIQKIAKGLGLSYSRVKKADLIQKIVQNQPAEQIETDDDILSRAKSELKKYIKLNHGTLSVKSSFEHLSSQFKPGEYKKIEKHKDQLKKYIKEVWDKYEEKTDEDLDDIKKTLKKYIKFNLDTVNVKSAFKYLSTKLTAEEYKKAQANKPELKKYIESVWEKEYKPKDESKPVEREPKLKTVGFQGLKETDTSEKVDKRNIQDVLEKAREIVEKYMKKHPEATEKMVLERLSNKLTDFEYNLAKQYKDQIIVIKSTKKEDVKKYTVVQLKEHLKKIGVTEPLRGKLKADFVRYSESDRCDPEKGTLCKGDYEVCDIRNNLCVFEEDIPLRKGLKKYEYNGYTVYGTDEQISKIKKEKSTLVSVDMLSEDDIIDTMITFIKTYKEKISNVKLIEHLKKTFDLSDSLKKIEEKFYPFLKSLYKDVKQSNIGYKCVDGVCILTRDRNAIKYSTVEECKLDCAEKKVVEKQNYFACHENKCVAVSLDEAEYKTKSECREECGFEMPASKQKDTVKPKKEQPADNRLMILGEKGVVLKEIDKIKPRIIKREIDDFTGKKSIIHDDKKIHLRDVKEPEKTKVVKEIDNIIHTNILYDNEIDKHTLALMKCLGLILVS